MCTVQAVMMRAGRGSRRARPPSFVIASSCHFAYTRMLSHICNYLSCREFADSTKTRNEIINGGDQATFNVTSLAFYEAQLKHARCRHIQIRLSRF